jgi:hypothetical protein
MVAAMTGCASEPAAVNSGDMCGQIAHFANSPMNDHGIHWVELTSDRKCTSDSQSYEPGARLCQYLTTTTSPDIDRARALECLHDTLVDRSTEGQPTTVRYTARLAEGADRFVIVRVEYPADTQVKTSLKISSQRAVARWQYARH